MAIGRLSMKIGKAGKAGPHAAYLARQGKYADRLERGEKLEATEAGNLPAWSQHDPQLFWQAADVQERVNGTTYREMEIALPRELDPSQRLDLVRSFVRQEIGSVHAYQWAIHTPKAVDGEDQPHLHLMFSERRRDGIDRDPEQYFRRYNAKAPEKGGARKGYGPEAGKTLTAVERTKHLKDLRHRWQTMANRHLKDAGHAQRIDMRSHAERETGLVPEAKQLPSQWRGQGRDNVIEFRQAKRDQVEAADLVDQVIPNAGVELRIQEIRRKAQEKFAAEKAAAKQEADRKAAQAQAEQQEAKQKAVAAQQAEVSRQKATEQAERLRIERMSAAELRAEIDRIRPPAVHEVVARLPEVIAAREERDALQRQLQQAQAQIVQAGRQAKEWREAHSVQAKLHDSGIKRSSVLMDAERSRQAAEVQQQLLQPRVQAAEGHMQLISDRLGQVVHWEQAPERARMAELEAVERQRMQQEQAERARTQAVDKVLSTFKSYALKRELRSGGYGDAGQQWNAISPEMRGQIDKLNALPKESRSAVLARIRENLLSDPKGAEKLSQQLNQGRQQDRGRGR